MTDAAPAFANLELVCCRCPASRIFGPLPVAGASRSEQYDAIQPSATREGWTDVSDPTGRRAFLCPKCSADEHHRQTGPLPAFDPRAKCPKCGHARVATRYCDGLAPLKCPADLHREHLHRACLRCQFCWVQGTKDQRTETPAVVPVDEGDQSNGSELCGSAQSGG